MKKNSRFKSGRLHENTEKDAYLQNSEKYKITKSNFDRFKNGPLNTMQSVLNE